MNFTQLRAFEAVARTGSVTRAAADLRVSPAAISVHLRELERAHGIAIIERVRRRPQLTPAGRALYDYARRIFALSDEADSALGLMRDLRSGALRLGATDTPARSWVPRALGPFRRRFPGIRVDLYVGNTAHVVERLAMRQDDVAVVAAAVQHRDLVVEPVGFDPVVVIVPRRHPWRTRPAVRLRELQGEPLIVREPGSSTRQLIEAEFARKMLRPDIAMELGSHDAIIGAVEQGVGVSLVPASLVEPGAGRPRRYLGLRSIRVSDARLRHTVSVVCHGERASFPLTREFLAIMRTLRVTSR
jgi:LysR family transcriptional regulator, low CO2-responsive transcriptional regulator